MNKLDINPTTLTYTVQPDVDATHALLVLVSVDVDYTAATRQIWELANTTEMHVRLLGLCRDAAEEVSLHRKLVTMASLLRDAKVTTETRVRVGTNWLDSVKSNYEAGDVIVCFAQQRTGLWQRPLSQILESNFKGTVYILSGFTRQPCPSSTLSQLLAWLGCIGILVGFGFLQTRLVELPEGWLQSTGLILSIIPEFLLLWFWNGLFG